MAKIFNLKLSLDFDAQILRPSALCTHVLAPTDCDKWLNTIPQTTLCDVRILVNLFRVGTILACGCWQNTRRETLLWFRCCFWQRNSWIPSVCAPKNLRGKQCGHFVDVAYCSGNTIRRDSDATCIYLHFSAAHSRKKTKRTINYI